MQFFECSYQKMTEREKQEFNKATSSKETVEPPIKKLKMLEPLKKGQGKSYAVTTVPEICV